MLLYYYKNKKLVLCIERSFRYNSNISIIMVLIMKKVKQIFICIIFSLIIFIPINIKAKGNVCEIVAQTTEDGKGCEGGGIRFDWKCIEDGSVSSFTIYESNENGVIGNTVYSETITLDDSNGSFCVNEDKKIKKGNWYYLSFKTKVKTLVPGPWIFPVWNTVEQIQNFGKYYYGDPSNDTVAKTQPSITASNEKPYVPTTKRSFNFKTNKSGGSSYGRITGGICDENLKAKIRKYWGWLTILTPIALIIFCTIDFVKAMSLSDSDAIKKSSSKAIKRTIAAIILFALPMLLKIIFTWAGIEEYMCF